MAETSSFTQRPTPLQVLTTVLVTIILLVFVIPSVILAVTPRMGRGSSKVAAAKSDLATLDGELHEFRLDCGRFPTTQEGLSSLRQCPPALAATWKGPYQNRDIPNDPWGNPYLYAAIGNSYRMTSYGADGKPGGEDENKDITDEQALPDQPHAHHKSFLGKN